MTYALGIDFGTSGARAIALDSRTTVVAEARHEFSAADLREPMAWRAALFALLAAIPVEIRAELGAIALNGTSSTVLLCDEQGQPLVPPLLYHDACGQAGVSLIRTLAPADSAALSATSSLAKLLWWCGDTFDQIPAGAAHLLHQADWLAWCLHGQLGWSDYHNALKLGYDVGALRYPDWLLALSVAPLFPQVVAPGQPIAPVLSAIATDYHLSPTCTVCAGTTDSIAAFLASGAHQPGDAVTSLGSTLVLKLLSQQRVDQVEFGIYSHRLGDQWLVGGASNTGGQVLRQFFSAQELRSLSGQINPEQPTGLNYYPLIAPGERFPIYDPQLEPCLSPQPENPVIFLQALLEGMAQIEALGYQRLQAFGASPLRRVLTAGGGAQNQPWQTIRAQKLGVPVMVAPQTEAAYGTALLALRSQT